MTGQGGWPMTCVLDPGGRRRSSPAPTSPTSRGTGSPRSARCWRRSARPGRPRRDEVAGGGRRRGRPPAAAGRPGRRRRRGRPRRCSTRRSPPSPGSTTTSDGGFGGAPKFPPSMVLEFLLRHAARTGRSDALRMVGGTPARRWPAAASTTSSPAASRATRSTPAGWCRTSRRCSTTTRCCCGVYTRWWRRPATRWRAGSRSRPPRSWPASCAPPEGGFASALDADTEGVEGRYYVWTPDAAGRGARCRGRRLGRASCSSVTEAGTFEHGASMLQLRARPRRRPARWARVRARLLEARAGRTAPARDDKVVAAWNGLAIAALAEAGALLGDAGAASTAARRDAADLLVRVHLDDGRLLRVSRDGVAGAARGRARGLRRRRRRRSCALLQATGDARLAGAGRRRCSTWRWTSSRDDDGGFYDTADDAEHAGRPAAGPDRQRQPVRPVGAGARAAGLRRAHRLGTPPGRGRGARCARPRRLAERVPRFAGWWLAAAEAALDGPLEVAVVGATATRPGTRWPRRPAAAAVPGAVVVVARPRDDEAVPLLAGRASRRRPRGGVRLPGDGLRAAGHRSGRAARDAAGLSPPGAHPGWPGRVIDIRPGPAKTRPRARPGAREGEMERQQPWDDPEWSAGGPSRHGTGDARGRGAGAGTPGSAARVPRQRAHAVGRRRRGHRLSTKRRRRRRLAAWPSPPWILRISTPQSRALGLVVGSCGGQHR